MDTIKLELDEHTVSNLVMLAHRLTIEDLKKRSVDPEQAFRFAAALEKFRIAVQQVKSDNNDS